MDAARKGDLVVYEVRRRDSYIGQESKDRVEFRAAKIVGVKRDGTVARIAGSEGTPIEAGPRGAIHGWHRCWVVSSDTIDVDAAVIACASNPWPHDPQYIHCPFDSLDAITAIVRRYKHTVTA